MVDRTGEQIGNYRMVQLLGSGGFADVYLGQQVYLDSPAAIKLLRTNLAKEDWESFRAEARTLVRLVHPHIIRLLEFGLDGNTPYLVMDYAPNGTIRQRHQRGERLPLATAVDYVKQVASALQYAHDEKVIHRDIKPENMLLGRQNEILLTDFGIAIVAQSTLTQLTQETVGTIVYMAPEQIQSHPRPASDQYSLGVVVYEWLSGNPPFIGTFTELAAKHMMALPPPLRATVPDIPPDVEEVVLTALAKDPKQRFGSVKAFATALEHASRVSKTISEQETVLPTLLPTILASPLTPAPPVPFSEVAQPANSPVVLRPLQPTELANAPGTPALPPFELKRSPAAEKQAKTIYTPPYQPQQQDIPVPVQHELVPARRGISRRAVLFGGIVVVVGVAGGATLFALQSHSSTSSGPAILAEDTFNRTNPTGWGTASDGQKWNLETNTLDFSIVDGIGQIQQGGNGGELTAILGPSFTDADLLVSGSLSDFTNSQLGLALRWTDDRHYYKAFIDGTNLNVLKRQNQVGLLLQRIPFLAQPGVSYTIRFRVIGTTLEAKAWRTANAEPLDWRVRATDNTFHSGFGGLRSNVNHGVTLQITHFLLTMATHP